MLEEELSESSGKNAGSAQMSLSASVSGIVGAGSAHMSLFEFEVGIVGAGSAHKSLFEFEVGIVGAGSAHKSLIEVDVGIVGAGSAHVSLVEAEVVSSEGAIGAGSAQISLEELDAFRASVHGGVPGQIMSALDASVEASELASADGPGRALCPSDDSSVESSKSFFVDFTGMVS